MHDWVGQIYIYIFIYIKVSETSVFLQTTERRSFKLTAFWLTYQPYVQNLRE